MSRWHRENPEHYERYGEPDWREMADNMRTEAKEGGRAFCVACGEPTNMGRRWCSESCRRSEDGPQPDEIPDNDE